LNPEVLTLLEDLLKLPQGLRASSSDGLQIHSTVEDTLPQELTLHHLQWDALPDRNLELCLQTPTMRATVFSPRSDLLGNRHHPCWSKARLFSRTFDLEGPILLRLVLLLLKSLLLTTTALMIA
jgi:hypothetical protein